MSRTVKATLVVFVTIAALNLVGVMFFFKPIADGDDSVVSLHPLIGFTAYVGLCTGIYLWAVRATGSSRQAAIALAAPQVALVVDLALRGERGLLTMAAGIALLAVTWAAVGWAHAWVAARVSGSS